MMTSTRIGVVTLLALLGQCWLTLATMAQTAPEYQVQASWPLPLPNNWILGQVSGIAVDQDDNIWIVHRPKSISASEAGAVQSPPLADCCVPAPSVLQFDQAGNLLRAWGGPSWDQDSQTWRQPDVDWPMNEHGIFVDDEGFVWLGGNGPDDHIVLKYSADGQHLLTIGKVGETGGSNDTERLGRPADVAVDTEAREVYVADGYGNRRIIVFDADSGVYKRHWGAYGRPPSDDAVAPYQPGNEPAPVFLGVVHTVLLGQEGRLYMTDRDSNRIQVFEKDGSFVMESVVAPWTLGNGSTWDLAISPYDDHRWLFVADGQNMKVWILDRSSLEVVSSFGRGGRQAGQFDWVHNVAVDSQGNLYTAEVNNGRRVQKFILGD